jgi:hypothetical protein
VVNRVFKVAAFRGEGLSAARKPYPKFFTFYTLQTRARLESEIETVAFWWQGHQRAVDSWPGFCGAKPRPTNERAQPDHRASRNRVTLLTDAGIEQFILEDANSLAFIDPELQKKVAAASLAPGAAASASRQRLSFRPCKTTS